MPYRPPFSDDDAFPEEHEDADPFLFPDNDPDIQYQEALATPSDDDAVDDREIELADFQASRRRVGELLNVARGLFQHGELQGQSTFEYVRDCVNPAENACLEEIFWTLRPKQQALVQGAKQSETLVRALLVDDDKYEAREYGLALSAIGVGVAYAFSADDALRILNDFRDNFDFVVLDIRMPCGDYFSSFAAESGKRTGIALAAEVGSMAPSAILVALTNSRDPGDQSWFEAQEGAIFCRKAEYPPDKFVQLIRREIMKDRASIKSFIIHGHDKLAALDLKNYLQNTLGFPEPIILSEKKSKGMTVIEKLEHYLSDADLVFALFTPDDFTSHPTTARRARQNVMLEFGIVLGMFGRKSGRVFYLYKQGVEIPSDLAGVIYIDVSAGVASAGEQIRAELEDYLAS